MDSTELAQQQQDRQTLERLSWLAIVMPALFLLALLALVDVVVMEVLPRPWALVFAFVAGAAGIVIFSRAMFSAIEKLQSRLHEQNRDLERHTRQLLALWEAGDQIAAQNDLASVLQNVVDSSRELVNARYGAIAVLDDGAIKHFVTSGMTEEEREAIGNPPEGKGLIGHLLEMARPYRTADMASDPHAVGFPPRHPEMHSLLGVPVIHADESIGNIYLTEKTAGEFTAEDEEIVSRFAVQAAIAIEKARLNSQIEEVAVLEDRERIAMELHDGTIQALYGVGLRIEDCLERLEAEPQAVREDLDTSIESLNTIIRDIRRYIFDLRPGDFSRQGLQQALRELLQDLSINTLMTTELKVVEAADGLDPTALLSEQQSQDVYEMAQEAMNNIRQHSRAHNVYAEIGIQDGSFWLRIVDDGIGLANKGDGIGDGIAGGITRMTERAHELQGTLILAAGDEGGTSLTVQIPVASEKEHV